LRCGNTALPDEVCTAKALEQVASAADVDSGDGRHRRRGGIRPCLSAAARAGKRLLLANKEALVVGGQYFMMPCNKAVPPCCPIDSEHSAIFQCLPPDRSIGRGASTTSY
jgi:1-deoxy-D-xylulose-5-phosphate reductoisomerase